MGIRGCHENLELWTNRQAGCSYLIPLECIINWEARAKDDTVAFGSCRIPNLRGARGKDALQDVGVDWRDLVPHPLMAKLSSDRFNTARRLNWASHLGLVPIWGNTASNNLRSSGPQVLTPGFFSNQADWSHFTFSMRSIRQVLLPKVGVSISSPARPMG